MSSTTSKNNVIKAKVTKTPKVPKVTKVTKKRVKKVREPLKLRYNTKKRIIEAGIDEAGRGCLAGPVYAAAVILPETFPDEVYKEIRDSKKLTEKKREMLFEYITQHVTDYAIISIPPKRIDKINILQATYEAMHSAVDNLAFIPDLIVVDGDKFKPYKSPHGDGGYAEHVCVIGGDDVYLAIGAASILAKVSRDRHMKKLCKTHPELDQKYGWVKNKAYGTKQHRDGIKQYGITEYHRKTFGICRDYADDETDEPMT